MAATEQAYEKEIKKAKFYIGEMEETLDTFDKDDLTIAHEKAIKLYQSLEAPIDAITGGMLDNDKPLDVVRSWAKTKKDELRIIREFKNNVKQKLNEFIASERQKEHERMIYEQKVMLEEQSKMNRAEQQQRGEERARQQKQEEDWFQKRFELEMGLVKKRSEDVSAKPQAVKLQ